VAKIVVKTDFLSSIIGAPFINCENKMDRLTISNALKAVSNTSQPFVELFRHGSMSVEFYQPHEIDTQQPHAQDELYVVASGSGYFVNGDTRYRFEAGEVLFVPAGVEHRFEDFTDDFATWVFFYGPEGGEGV
jgi:cupin superfamily acireductone dioxygenase involved in methionine salvage